MNINYQLLLEETINQLSERKTLLLHSCCGPCSSYVLDYLKEYFDITVYFYNPNIYPEDEFHKRLKEQIKVINKNTDYKIKIVEGKYNPELFYNLVEGLENEKEGLSRCYKCYEMRLANTAKLAKKNNFDYFGTTLSVSPYKNSKALNEIGKSLEEKYQVKYLYADFKKKDGYKKSIELSKKYELYRQDYCGCKFSFASRKNHEG